MKLFLRGETPAWKRLVRPLRYLFIRHDIKIRFDLFWPAILTIATVMLLYFLPKPPLLMGDAGVLKSMRDLIALLAAFFVAALAAVATFARDTLDKPMEGTSPTLDGKELTRRQFVSYLFGYLAFLAFALFFTIIFAQILVPSLWVWFAPDTMWWIKGIFGTLFVFASWNMAITTLLGIYFLVERVHLRDDA